MLTQAVEILSRLVACPSVNPLREIPQHPPFGEAALADLLKNMLLPWGAEVSIEEVSPGRPNLIARFVGPAGSPALMLEAHGDTVTVEGMTIPPFEGFFDGRRLWGRGSCDTKASLTAMMLGIHTVLEEQGSLPCTVYLVSTCDEEHGASGAYHLVAQGPHIDAAIVGEPTDLRIVIAHKGDLRWRVRALGVAAHSSNPDAGINAIYHMGVILLMIQDWLLPNLRKVIHPLLGSPTLSVGTIHGGTAGNIIPALCEIEIDRRVIPGETREEMTRALKEELDRLKAGRESFQYQIEERDWYPPFEEDFDAPITKLVTAAREKVLGKGTYASAPWAANAGVFKEGGIPCVLFGPGSIAQAHTKNEFIEMNQVVQAAEVFAEVIRGAGERLARS